jgi:3-methyladenine DNA glycosylase AlkD
MTLQQAIDKLRALANEKIRARNIMSGAGDRQFGVLLGDIRKIANEAKTDHDLALSLWKTENVDARLLAALIIQPGELPLEELEAMVRAANFRQLADWVNAYVVRKHPRRQDIRERWMADGDPWVARAGWDLTAERVAKNAEGLDLPALLDRIEADMPRADAAAQWTMNNTLAAIGIYHARHRKRAITIGEALGVYRDYPVSRGCTSPFAPIWIQEMVRRAAAAAGDRSAFGKRST